MAENWFTSMFDANSNEDDLIKSSPLNITKITALCVPLVTAAAAVLDAAVFKDDGVLSGLTPGQKLSLVLVLIAFVAVVVVADMMTRAKATAAALSSPVTILPAGIEGRWERPGADLDCSVVAARAGGAPGGDGTQLLITGQEDEAQIVRWVGVGEVAIG